MSRMKEYFDKNPESNPYLERLEGVCRSALNQQFNSGQDDQHLFVKPQ